VAQQELVVDDDDKAEVDKRNRLLLDAEKARKEAALAEKRKQVTPCRLMVNGQVLPAPSAVREGGAPCLGT